MQNLNKEQLKAVQHKDGPLLIVAGAGTGKTTVITQRIAYLIEQGLAKSDEILALTFTEKAAGEMEERVDKLLPMGYLDLCISTFHSFGERLLQAHGLEIGLPGDFKLLNEFEQYSLVKKNLDKLELDYYRPMGNPTKFIRVLIKHFSRLKDEDIGTGEYLKYAEDLQQNLDNALSGGKIKNKLKEVLAMTDIADKTGLRRRRSTRFASEAGSAPPRNDKEGGDDGDLEEMAVQEVKRINEVANAYHVYQQLLLDNNALDFGDLINYCLKLFRERPAILAKYRQQFQYILLDEFQDTNWAQYELIKLLASPKNNLMVIGDDDQAIYRFRGASMSNILQFQKDFPQTEQIFLVKNYRNRQNILDLSYEFIKQNDPNRLEWQLNKGGEKKGKEGKEGKEGERGLSKKLVAENKGKGVIEVIEGRDLGDEVNRTVEKIADLKIKDKEVNWSDFAILVRANESAKEFCNALEIAGLPHQFYSSRGLYSKPAIMDVIAYLKMLDNYHESAALYRVLNLPVFEFTYQELVNFNYFAKKKAWSLYEVLKSFPNIGLELKKKIDKAMALINTHTALTRDSSTSEVVRAFMNDSGYLKYLIDQDELKAQESIALLNQFLKRIKEFEANSDNKSVKVFLNELNLEIEAGEQGALPMDIDAGPDVIKVMTVHAAKGLEFKYVFIVNLVDLRFPTIERKEPISIPDALVKEILPEGDIHTEEERRLFYVAMTRAKENLYFTWAPDYGGVRKKKISRFLSELGLITESKKKGVGSRARGVGTKKLEMPVDKIKVGKQETQINLPSYFSYTQLTAFKNCPYQYYFAHILKVPTRGKFVFSFGQAMHLTLQKVFQLIMEKRGLGQGDLFNLTPPPSLKLRRTGSPSSKQERGVKNTVISLEEILELYEQSWIDEWYNSKQKKMSIIKKARRY